jgi:hypothetical protein
MLQHPDALFQRSLMDEGVLRFQKQSLHTVTLQESHAKLPSKMRAK